MEICLYGWDKAEIQAAAAWVLERRPAWERRKDPFTGGVRLEAEGGEAETAALLEEVLARFPGVQASLTIVSEVDGRDRSWWSTRRYESAAGPDGRRVMEYRGGSTDWA